jgi:hypothetical protein
MWRPTPAVRTKPLKAAVRWRHRPHVSQWCRFKGILLTAFPCSRPDMDPHVGSRPLQSALAFLGAVQRRRLLSIAALS